jgi:hypothetical protein
MYRTINNPPARPTDQLDGMWKTDNGRRVLNLTNAECKQITGSNTCFILSVVNGLLKSQEGQAYLSSLVTQTPAGMVVRFPGEKGGPGNLVPMEILVTPGDVARHRASNPAYPDTRPAVLVALECAIGSYIFQTYHPDEDFGAFGAITHGRMGEAETVARGLGLILASGQNASDPDFLIRLANEAGQGSSMLLLRRHNHFVSVSGQAADGPKTSPDVDRGLEREFTENEANITRLEKSLAEKLDRDPKANVAEDIESIEKRVKIRTEQEAVRKGIREGRTVDLKVFDSLAMSGTSSLNIQTRDTYDNHLRDENGRLALDSFGNPQFRPNYTQFFKFDLPKP